jgi:rhamnosyltransferase subunit B
MIIATVGSVGDLLPMLAIGRALRDANVETTIAAHGNYHEIAAIHGLHMTAIGSHEDPMNIPLRADQDDGISFIDYVNFTQLDQLFDQILDAATGAAALIAPYFVIPAHLVSEKLGIPLIACALTPSHIIRPLIRDKLSGARVERTPRRWHMQLADLRKRTGLDTRLFPYTAVLTTPTAILGTFPKFLCSDVTTTSVKMQVVGYPHLASNQGSYLDDQLQEFCDERTVLFSFGTHVDRYNPRFIYNESVAACRLIGVKCLYLSRFVEHAFARERHDSNVMLRSYVDHDAVLPYVGGIVHHGGLGTLMAACRHARPMTIVPYRYDQPYNAERMAALINAPTLPIARYDRYTLSNAMRDMLEQRATMRCAIKAMMAPEQDGAANAVREIMRAAALGRDDNHA